MNKYGIYFREICSILPSWTWQELLFGLKNNIIGIEDVVNYSNNIISDNIKDFEDIMEILIVDNNEVEDIVRKLALKEEKQNDDDIVSKWVFSIIYYLHSTNKNNIYDMIDDIYCEFDYPLEISGLVSYMPKEDGESRDDKLKKYIKRGENIWVIKK